MSVDPIPALPLESKKRRGSRSQLRVVLDTNALYVTATSIGSASDLVRQEIVNMIAEAQYPDLEVVWYIPEIVRHERQYQMQAEALKLRAAINRIERLLNHNLALPDSALLDHVQRKIEEKEKELGLQEIRLDHSTVDWPAIINAAAYRRPPFEAGEKEKGFRDALVAESFMQLLKASPRTPAVCRLVLITSDGALTAAVKERLNGVANASVLANVDELKGLINTIVSDVGEDFIALIKPKAGKLFFTSSTDKDAIYYKEKIRDRLSEKFKAELAATPPGTAFRTNGTWFINSPNFWKKEGKRVFWSSRIEVEVDAGNMTTQSESPTTLFMSSLNPSSGVQAQLLPTSEPNFKSSLQFFEPLATTYKIELGDNIASIVDSPATKKVISHKGRDKYEVLWSTEVTMSKELKKPMIEDMKHVEISVQPIA
jgi:hypothetical protein